MLNVELKQHRVGKLKFDLSGCEEVAGVGHRFELEVVPRRIFKEHGPLLADEAWEAQMRVDNEFYTVLSESFAQLMELMLAQNDPEMRDWHVVLIDMVAVFLWHEGIIDIAQN